MQAVTFAGTPFEVGQQHGRAYANLIREAAAERWVLSSSPTWTGRRLRPAVVAELADACVPLHADYDADLFAEMCGIADATGVGLAELLVLGGFTDFVDTVRNYRNSPPATPLQQAVDDCTAFLVPQHCMADGQAWFGQTWDMHESSLSAVCLMRLQVANHPALLTFTLAGCLGMIGMNEAGIAVGINNLLAANGQLGVTWPFVVRRILQQTDLQAALACITAAQLAGAHNYLLLDRSGNGYNVEAMPDACQITPLSTHPLVHSNHCLFSHTDAVAQPRNAASQASSVARLQQAQHWLSGSNPLTFATLQSLTRDSVICVDGQPPQHIATCGAVLACPAQGDFWVLKGKPTEGDYSRFHI